MNVANVVGTVCRAPVVRFEGTSQNTSFMLQILEPGRDGSTFSLYCPCVAWGKTSEAAAVLNAGDLVSVEGKIGWHKKKDKTGKDASALAIVVRQLNVLVPAPVEVSTNGR